MGIRGRRGHDERGVAALEFALVLVPFLMLVFGIVQYGFLLYSSQGANDITRDAARRAAVAPAPCTAFVDDLKAQIGNLKSTDTGLSITRTYSKGAGNTETGVQVGDLVTVAVKFRSHDMHFPFIPVLNNGQVGATGSARVEYVDGSLTAPVSCP